MNIVGHHIFGAKQLYAGHAYDYFMAANGIFVLADNDLLCAQAVVAEGNVRGLPPLNPFVSLGYGKIPGYLFELALNIFGADPGKEKYLAIKWFNGAYHLINVNQKRAEASVEYEHIEEAVMDIHSHCNMPAVFSSQDDADEQGLRIYGVVGKLGDKPEVLLRVGVYGYFYCVHWDEVFSGTLTITDVAGKKEESANVPS